MSNINTSALKKLLESLKNEAKKHENVIFNYAIPELWNIHNYNDSKTIHTPSGDVLVNPYNFLISLIENEILPNKKARINYSKSLATINKENNNGDWIKNAVAYSILPRASAAYDHDRSGNLELSNMYSLKETGTFVKALALLPLLKKMGVTLVYMLPIAEYTRMYKKGEMGSPYGVKDFYHIDKDLFDPITGNLMTVNEQFKAFVEACHILGLRVMLDYIPRTNSRDSVLTLSHPEWFYWIKKEDELKYKTPWVEGVDVLTVPEPKYAKNIYTSPEVINFIKLFQKDPKTSNPKKWEKILAYINEHPEENNLEVIERETGLTVAPAFADVMNDPQPAWSDVTYFRMYLDNPLAAQEFVDKATNPYMLFDIAKASLNPGAKPNVELWDTLSGIIPYYQKEFGIDGIRIDMGHALPNELTSLIFKRAKENDPNFSFVAEELQSERAKFAKEIGYNMFIGDGFYHEPRVYEFNYHEFFYTSKNLAIPCFASCETHDTKRATARNGGRNLTKLLTVMNMFTPNTVPFINSGQEIYEIQPINTGLDCLPSDAFVLNSNDPMYGKLALFDKYSYHYNSDSHFELPDILEILTEIRNSDIETFTNPENAIYLGFSHMREHGVGVGYVVKNKLGEDNIYLIIGHTHVHNAEHITCKIEDVRMKAQNNSRRARIIFSTHESPRTFTEFNNEGNLNLYMQPGEVKIIKL